MTHMLTEHSPILGHQVDSLLSRDSSASAQRGPVAHIPGHSAGAQGQVPSSCGEHDPLECGARRERSVRTTAQETVESCGGTACCRETGTGSSNLHDIATIMPLSQ